MTWDLSLAGLGLLMAMSLGFGLLAQIVAGRGGITRWLWLVAAASYFVSGLITSEVFFGWATEEELQPNVGGLSFDEVLLLGLLGGITGVLITRHLSRRRHHQRRASSAGRPRPRHARHTRA